MWVNKPHNCCLLQSKGIIHSACYGRTRPLPHPTQGIFAVNNLHVRATHTHTHREYGVLSATAGAAQSKCICEILIITMNPHTHTHTQAQLCGRLNACINLLSTSTATATAIALAATVAVAATVAQLTSRALGLKTRNR